jgi:amino acid transporter
VRPLGFFSLLCLGVNAVVGSSIFLFPGKLAALLGPASVLSFLLTGVLLAGVALCFAELARGYDSHGGPYLYARDAFGPAVGFGIGWSCWIAEILSCAAVADGIGVYAGLPVKPVAAAAILALGALNYRGVKPGAWTSNILTVAKLLPLLLLVVLGLPRLHLAPPLAPHGWQPLGRACFLAYFAFSGFECVPVPAGESKDAGRHVPMAVLGALLISTALYTLIQAVYVSNVGVFTDKPLADLSVVLLGSSALITAGAAVSMTGFVAGCALSGPRYLMALGLHGDMPAAAGRARPAVVVTTLLSLACALLLDFDTLVDIGVIVICAQYVATCAAAVKLRGRWALGLWGIGATLWLGAQGGKSEILAALGVTAGGFAIRYFLRSRS